MRPVQEAELQQPDAAEGKVEPRRRQPLWPRLRKFVEKIPPEDLAKLPTDLAAHFDEYDTGLRQG